MDNQGNCRGRNASDCAAARKPPTQTYKLARSNGRPLQVAETLTSTIRNTTPPGATKPTSGLVNELPCAGMYEQFKGLSLLGCHVDYGRLEPVPVPQVDNASFAGPLAASGCIETSSVQGPRGTGFDCSTQCLCRLWRADYGMYMSRADMNRPRKPSVQHASLENCLQDASPSWPVKGKRLDAHLTLHRGM